MNYDAVGAVPLWSYECYRLVMECIGKLCGAEYMYVGDVPL